MYFLKIVAVTMYLSVFPQLAHAEKRPFNGMWVEVYPDSTAEKLRERCEKFDEGIYLGILFVDGLSTEYLKANRVSWGNIKKMQRLKNTRFEVVDISYGSGRLTDEPQYDSNRRELWSISKNKKKFTKVHLIKRKARISNWRLCKKLHEHE